MMAETKIKTWMRGTLRKLLRSRGYELARLDRFGARPWVDIRRIFGHQAVEVLFDVGANEGQTALAFANAFPNAAIHSFEPFEDAFRALQRATAGFPAVRPVQCALGESSGQGSLFVNRMSFTNSLLPNALDAPSFVHPGETTNIGMANIAVSTLDDYCRERGLQFVDLLKMDTQGYELKVLQGSQQMLSQGKVAIIFTEVLFTPLYDGQAYFQDVYNYLWRRGFRLVGLYEVVHNDQKFASWCDAMFLHPEALKKRTENRPSLIE